MGKPKVTVGYASGSGANILFNLSVRNDGQTREERGVTPQYIANFLRQHEYRGGQTKLDVSGVNEKWVRYFHDAAR